MKKQPYPEDRLKALLDYIEEQEYVSGGWRRQSGGFANAEKVGHDEEYVDITLRSGVESDNGSQVYTTHYKIRIEWLEYWAFTISEVYDRLEDA